jgi:hypothetical protein
MLKLITTLLENEWLETVDVNFMPTNDKVANGFTKAENFKIQYTNIEKV